MRAVVLSKKNSYPEYTGFDIEDKYKAKEKIKIIASALNHRDLWIIKGQYAGIKYPIILGSDGMGIYLSKRVIINPGQYWGDNENVQSKNFKILGLPDHGTMADYVYTDRQFIYDVPSHLSDIELSALPLGGLTAYRAMFSRGKAKAGEKILIAGIGGGVALFVLQFAIAMKMEVYVTSSSEEKIEKAKSLGAKGGVNYNNTDWAKQLNDMSGGIDIIIDSAAGEGFNNYLKIINPGGRIVIYGGTRGKIKDIIPQIVFWKQISILGSTMGSDKDFKNMLAFVEKYKIKPVIDSVFAIEDQIEAFKRMESGKQFGKIVLVNPDN
jgi:D-arabinose 1-dehydrogenase-like Zn-dependent alcohol dehydrogenase